MQTLILYGSTLLVFLIADAIGITFVIKPAFDRHVPDLIAETMRLGPAAAFYLLYVVGVLYFVSMPAMASGKTWMALVNGALLGLMCYATYEFTNIATLRGWSWEQVILDTLWGGILTGGSAYAGILITQYFRPS